MKFRYKNSDIKFDCIDHDPHSGYRTWSVLFGELHLGQIEKDTTWCGSGYQAASYTATWELGEPGAEDEVTYFTSAGLWRRSHTPAYTARECLARCRQWFRDKFTQAIAVGEALASIFHSLGVVCGFDEYSSAIVQAELAKLPAALIKPASGFEPGSGCYTCNSCGKLTRETGEGESRCDLCAACYYEAGLENTHNDDHVDFVAGCKWCEAEQRETVKPTIEHTYKVIEVLNRGGPISSLTVIALCAREADALKHFRHWVNEFNAGKLHPNTIAIALEYGPALYQDGAGR
jgi:hypothetical protein